MSDKLELTIKSPIAPAGDKLVVIQLKEKEHTVGGLYIPETNREKPAVGILLAKGFKVEEEFKIPSFLCFGRYAGYEQKIDNAIYLILREDEILGTVSDEKAIQEYETGL